MSFQNDGALAHFHRDVRNYLDGCFPNRWIGRGGAIRRPSRSPDINPLDFFLWGHYKAIIHGRTLPRNREDLMNRIVQTTDSVTEEMLANCWQNLLKRGRKYVEVGGGQFEHLL